MPTTAEALDRLAALPDVPEAVQAARAACTALAWHRTMRRRTAEAAAEAGVRAARASAALAGARFPVEVFRDVTRGAAAFPDDAAGRTALGVVRASAEIERLGRTWSKAPGQALARLHTAASAGLLPDEALGRPRRAGEPAGDGADLLAPDGRLIAAVDGAQIGARLAGLTELLTAPPEAPALVLAALVLAEVATVRPFVSGNGVVARALCRAVIVGRGLDPTGVAIWEAGLLAIGPQYPLALARYAVGGADGVAHWLRTFAQALLDGVGEGQAVCDAVLAGRTGA